MTDVVMIPGSASLNVTLDQGSVISPTSTLLTILDDGAIQISGTINVDTSATIANLAYPTSDGVSGSSIVTDGAGNLSFSTSPGVFGSIGEQEVAFGDSNGDITSSNSLIFSASSQHLIVGNGAAAARVVLSGSNPSIRFHGPVDSTLYGDLLGASSAGSWGQGLHLRDESFTSRLIISSSGNTHVNGDLYIAGANEDQANRGGSGASGGHIGIGQDSGNVEVQMYAGTNGLSSLAAYENGSQVAYIRYDSSVDDWIFYTEGASRYTMDATSLSPALNNAYSLGVDSLRYNNAYFSDAIYVANAQNSGWASFADDLLIGDGTGSVGITTFPGDSDIAWWATRDSSDNDTMAIFQDINTDRIGMRIGGGTRYNFYTTYFAPSSNGASDLGESGTRFGTTYTVDLNVSETGSISGLQYPIADGVSGSLIVTDGAGTLSFSSQAAMFGSINENEIAFGDSNGDITSDPTLTYDNSSQIINLGDGTQSTLILFSASLGSNAILRTEGVGQYIVLGNNDGGTILVGGDSGNSDIESNNNNLRLITSRSQDNMFLRTDNQNHLTLDAGNRSSVFAGDLTGSTHFLVGDNTQNITHLTILSDQNGFGYINFEDDISQAGRIWYDHANNDLLFTAGGLTHFRVGDSSVRPNTVGGVDLGSSTNWWGNLYAATGTFGDTSSPDTHVILRSSASGRGDIEFFDGSTSGYIRYSHSDDSMRWAVDGDQVVSLFQTEFRPTSAFADIINLGNSNNRWNDGWFTGSLYVAGGLTGANSSFDDLIVGSNDGAGAYGVTVDVRNDAGGGYAFRGSNATRDGAIQYDDGNRRIQFVAENSIRVNIGSANIFPQTTNQLDLGTNANRWKDGYLEGSLFVAGAATGVASTNADDLVIGTDSDTVTGQTFFATNTGTSHIYFGDSDSELVGRIQYEHASDKFRLYTNNTTRMQIDAGSVRPGFNNVLDLGEDATRWRNLFTSNFTYLANAPNSGWNSTADELVVGAGTLSNVGQSWYPADSGSVRFFVRQSDDDVKAGMTFNMANNNIFFTVDNTTSLVIEDINIRPNTNSGMNLGTTAIKWSSGYFNNFLRVANAGAVTANTNYDDIVVGDGTGAVGISLISPTNSANAIAFGDTANADAGLLRYDHNQTRFEFVVEGSQELNLSTTSFFPHTAGGLNNGTDQFGWNALYLNENVSAPGTPTNSVVIYSDTTDPEIRVKYDTGTTRRLHGAFSCKGRIELADAANGTEVAVGLGNAQNSSTRYTKATIADSSGVDDVQILAPFSGYVYFALRGTTSTSGNGWGSTTVRLYTNRSTSTTRDSDTQTFSSDAGLVFDLSGYEVQQGDLVHITVEVTNNDGFGEWSLYMEPS